jgi:hypothetical protein
MFTIVVEPVRENDRHPPFPELRVTSRNFVPLMQTPVASPIDITGPVLSVTVSNSDAVISIASLDVASISPFGDVVVTPAVFKAVSVAEPLPLKTIIALPRNEYVVLQMREEIIKWP